MPAAANLSINDGTAAVVFTPDSITGTHVVYQNLAVAELAKRELLHMDRPARAGNEVRRQVRINMPIVTGTDAQGKEVIELVTFQGTMISPAKSTPAQRLRCRTLGVNAMSSAAFVAVSDNPEWVY